jgi:hypothetical protein
MPEAMQTERTPAVARSDPPGLARLVSTDMATAMEQFQDPELLSEGKVNVISLEAVVQRLGVRWPTRRDQVYDHAERTLEKHLGLRGYFARVSETDFLICQPELGRFSAQAACLRYLREILNYFLGDARAADHGVHQVTKMTGDSIVAEKIDARHAEREGEVEEAERRKATAEAAAQTAQVRTMDQWSPFVASDGRELRVSCQLEPVFELKSFGRIGFRMARRVLVVGTEEALSPTQVANLSRADLLRIDLATIARGLDRLKSGENAAREPSLIIPVSFATLSNQRARTQIAVALKTAGELVQRGIISDICDIEGVPQGALLSAASLIRPFSLFVVGRLSVTPPGPASLAQMKGAGLNALSFECPRHATENDFLEWAKTTIDAAKQVTKPVLAYGAGSAREAGMMALLGATHASVRN